MPQSPDKLAILFADICGSTAMYENLGDEAARTLIARCLDTMEKVIPAHRGELIKTIGDEIMVVFPGAEKAFHAACAMQHAVEREFTQAPIPIHIRVGFNYGAAIRDSSDVFGNAVNVAARIAAITRGGQIMATQAVFDALPVQLQDRMRRIFRTELRGSQDQFGIYQVVCRQEDMHSTRSGMANHRKTPTNHDEMLLRYHDISIKIDKERRSIALGRGDACDLTVHTELASRLHCHIELRYGKFVLVDGSTNGTFVRFSDGSEQHITREELILHGSGSIGLGLPPGDEKDEQVMFAVTAVHAHPAT